MAETRGGHVWRRELLRGAVIFLAVVLMGIAGIHVARAVAAEWAGLAHWLGPFAWDEAGDAEWVEAFRWAGTLADGDRVYLRNTNGPILVEAVEGESLYVVAQKRWRHSDPEIVRIDALRHAGGVTFCALWEARAASCGPDGDYQLSNPDKNDVAVRFSLYLPAGAGVDLSTVNGGVTVEGGSGPVTARTVNGAIAAVVRSAPFSARTVNGNVDAEVGRLAGEAAGEIVLQTVNGSVSAEVGGGVGAEVEASTVTGRVDNELPITDVTHSTRRLKGRLGAGGPLLKLQTVNGAVHLGALYTDPGAIAPSAPRSARPPTAQRPPIPTPPRPAGSPEVQAARAPESRAH